MNAQVQFGPKDRLGVIIREYEASDIVSGFASLHIGDCTIIFSSIEQYNQVRDAIVADKRMVYGSSLELVNAKNQREAAS